MYRAIGLGQRLMPWAIFVVGAGHARDYAMPAICSHCSRAWPAPTTNLEVSLRGALIGTGAAQFDIGEGVG